MEKARELQKIILFSPWGLKVGQDLATEQQQPIENLSLSHHLTTRETDCELGGRGCMAGAAGEEGSRQESREEA